jgi:D-amino-acid oxidase
VPVAGAPVVVVGAGVVGLSCALRLLEAGRQVDVIAAATGGGTTSAVAAALWYPYRAAPQDAVTRWSASTFTELVRLASVPGSGVRVRRGRELLREPSPDPWWRSAVPGLERLPAGELPVGYADGWSFEAPVADMPVYLEWLAARVAAAGGRFTRRRLRRLPVAPLVVNATGLGARELVPDPSLAAVRGQVLLVAQPGIDDWLLDQSDVRRPLYVVPRGTCVVVGGTADEGEEDLTPSAETGAQVLARAQALEPRLRAARVLATRVGLRPARPAVRLEAEQTSTGTVLHCYGHGGAGVTLSWGCADEVARAIAGL